MPGQVVCTLERRRRAQVLERTLHGWPRGGDEGAACTAQAAQAAQALTTLWPHLVAMA